MTLLVEERIEAVDGFFLRGERTGLRAYIAAVVIQGIQTIGIVLTGLQTADTDLQRLGRTAGRVLAGNETIRTDMVLADDVIVGIYIVGHNQLTVLIDTQLVEHGTRDGVPGDCNRIGLDAVNRYLLLYLRHIEVGTESCILHHDELFRIRLAAVGPHLELKALVRHSRQGDTRAFGIRTRSVHVTVVGFNVDRIYRQRRYDEMQGIYGVAAVDAIVFLAVVAGLIYRFALPSIRQFILANGDDVLDEVFGINGQNERADTIATRYRLKRIRIDALPRERTAVPDIALTVADSGFFGHRVGLMDRQVHANDRVATVNGQETVVIDTRPVEVASVPCIGCGAGCSRLLTEIGRMNRQVQDGYRIAAAYGKVHPVVTRLRVFLAVPDVLLTLTDSHGLFRGIGRVDPQRQTIDGVAAGNRQETVVVGVCLIEVASVPGVGCTLTGNGRLLVEVGRVDGQCQAIDRIATVDCLQAIGIDTRLGQVASVPAVRRALTGRGIFLEEERGIDGQCQAEDRVATVDGLERIVIDTGLR